MVMGRQDYQWKHEPCLYGWKDGAGHLWASDRKQTTIINWDRPSRNAEHPTMKPIGLFDYQIKNNTKGGDIVLDLFGGSGTTLMACEQNKRIAYLMELDPKYCDVIVERWEKFTGKKAVLVNA
jgi:site-specific DNA-methyltransferase (adenine-specific)